MHAALVTTPTDMRPFVGGHDYVLAHLVPLDPCIEPTIRRVVDDVFTDLCYIGDDPDLVSTYLESISGALETLREHGLAILAINTRGTYKLDDGQSISNWIRTYFDIVPALGYFRVQADNARVHRFAPACDAAMADLLQAAKKEGSRLAIWSVPILIQARFHNDVPWCDQCCSGEKASFTKPGASVKSPDLRITSEIVRRAIDDAESLLKAGGPISAIDRVHTALHGYLKRISAEAEIVTGKDPTIIELFGTLRQHHPKLKNLGTHEESTLKVLRALANVTDALNSVRNRGSMAHPSEALLDSPEATLFINAARTLLQYLDTKLS